MPNWDGTTAGGGDRRSSWGEKPHDADGDFPRKKIDLFEKALDDEDEDDDEEKDPDEEEEEEDDPDDEDEHDGDTQSWDGPVDDDEISWGRPAPNLGAVTLRLAAHPPGMTRPDTDGPPPWEERPMVERGCAVLSPDGQWIDDVMDCASILGGGGCAPATSVDFRMEDPTDPYAVKYYL